MKRKSWKETRKSMKFTQQEFWGAIGVTQSAASRYEGGRTPPLPVKLLLMATYENGLLEPSTLLAMARTASRRTS